MLKYLLLLLLLLLIYRYVRYVMRTLSKKQGTFQENGRQRKGGVDIKADREFISEMENSKKFNEGEYIDFEEIKEDKQKKKAP